MRNDVEEGDGKMNLDIKKESIRFALTLGIMSVIGFVVDFGIMCGWGLQPADLLLAWLSILVAASLGYWLAYFIVRTEKERVNVEEDRKDM